jgi:hypothetical protein
VANRTAPPAEEARGEDQDRAGVEEKNAAGRAASTPFMLLGSVAVTVWTAAAVVTGAALLAWWLA